MRVKKYLALLFVAILATTMLTGCPWDIEDDAASDSSGAPSSSSRPSHDSSDDDNDSGSAPSSPSTPEQPSDDEESGEPENPGDEEPEESEKPSLNEIFKDYGTVSDDGITLTITTTNKFSGNEFRPALNKATSIKKIAFAEGITSVPTGAFQGCTNLAHIRLGDNMEEYLYDPSDLFSNPTGVDPTAFNGIASKVHVYYGDNANAAQQKWEELRLNYNGTVIPLLDSEWKSWENDDNAAEALPDAMKVLLALAERLG